MHSVGQRAGQLGPRLTANACERPRAGLRILIPGYPQWLWRQRERAAVLFGSFAVALGVGAFSWGTWTGLAILAFAFGAHVFSVVDVVRQTAFPGFGRWAPMISASGGLALGVYVPTLFLATLVAWPAMDGISGPEGYLVNCCAFRTRPPDRGEWVWLRSSSEPDLKVGRVVAAAGEEVEWVKHQCHVQGSRTPGMPFRSATPPKELSYVVPDGHLLVDPIPAFRRRSVTKGLVLIPRDQIAGRAWAKMYPLWERRLLH